MPSLNPSREQLAAFAEQMPDDAPILMLNLLRYREAADYPADSEHAPCSGREAYRRYSRTALAKVQGVGGRVELLAAAQVALMPPRANSGTSCCWCATPPRRPFSACSPTPSTAPPPSTARRPWPTRG